MIAMKQHSGARMKFQPRIRRGAFFEAAWRYGCRDFSVYNRTYISSTFSNAIDEFWHVTEHVALWPVMGERQIEIAGPDAARFVQYLTPRDMSSCKVGQCKYILITAPDGGILCDPIAMRIREDCFWLSTSDCDLELWVKGLACNSGMDVTVRDAEVSVMQVQGPKSVALLVDMFGDQIADLKYYWSVGVPYHGSELFISRTGWSGEFGYELYLSDAALGDVLFDDLMTTGAPYNVKPGAVNQIRRLESGILSWGADMTAEENPFEVGLGRLVQLDKVQDCVGRDALIDIAERGPTRKLVGLTLEGSPLAGNEEPWPLRSGNRTIGKLTSIAYSPRLQKNIALGLVEIDYAQEGRLFEIDTWDGLRLGIVTPIPFVKKKQATDASSLLNEARTRDTSNPAAVSPPAALAAPIPCGPAEVAGTNAAAASLPAAICAPSGSAPANCSPAQ